LNGGTYIPTHTVSKKILGKKYPHAQFLGFF
jgi:hypothetical protein